MEESDLQQHRRERLAEWLQANGGLTKVAANRNLKPSYQSYLSQVTNGYSFGSRGTRSCEHRLGIPPGWLDAEVDSAVPATPEPPHPPHLDQALIVVAEALGGITAGRWTMVRARLDELAGRPEMRDDVVADVLPLLQPSASKQHQAA